MSLSVQTGAYFEGLREGKRGAGKRGYLRALRKVIRMTRARIGAETKDANHFPKGSTERVLALYAKNRLQTLTDDLLKLVKELEE